MLWLIIGILGTVSYLAAVIYVGSLVIRALRKYLRSTPESREREQTEKKTLSEVLKEERLRNGMTQEFVAEALGVSRQAISKWETGTSDPSTMNLLAIAHLYGVEAGDLLKRVSGISKGTGR